jgi:hypothetical protein
MKIKANYIALECDQYTACHMLVMLYQGSVESDNIKLTITDVLSNDVGMVALELYPIIDDEKEVYTVRMRLRGVEEIKNFPYTQMNKMLNNRLIPFWMTEIDKCVESMKGLN